MNVTDVLYMITGLVSLALSIVAVLTVVSEIKRSNEINAYLKNRKMK